jgi:hypothetical protein
MRWTRGRETKAGLSFVANETLYFYDLGTIRLEVGIAITEGAYTSGELTIDGNNIGAVSVLTNDSNSALRTAINAAVPGVTASLDANNHLVLTSTGDSIAIAGDDPASDVMVGLSAAYAAKRPLGYDGQDMHHKVYLSGSGADVALEGSVDMVNWFEIDFGTVGTGDSGKISVLVTGNLNDIPFKFVRLKDKAGSLTAAVDSFGTLVR